MCVCVRVCVRACACVCFCVCVSVCEREKGRETDRERQRGENRWARDGRRGDMKNVISQDLASKLLGYAVFCLGYESVLALSGILNVMQPASTGFQLSSPFSPCLRVFCSMVCLPLSASPSLSLHVPPSFSHSLNLSLPSLSLYLSLSLPLSESLEEHIDGRR